jgi:hypothetical protein
MTFSCIKINHQQAKQPFADEGITLHLPLIDKQLTYQILNEIAEMNLSRRFPDLLFLTNKNSSRTDIIYG